MSQHNNTEKFNDIYFFCDEDKQKKKLKKKTKISSASKINMEEKILLFTEKQGWPRVVDEKSQRERERERE